MSKTAVKIEGLSKSYRIGVHNSYPLFREVLTNAALIPYGSYLEYKYTKLK